MNDRERRKGRGATFNPTNRFSATSTHAEDDGWGSLDEPLQALMTTVEVDHARTIITYNDSPDLPIDRTINPYRGCEHGCSYCYARPSHARYGLSPGLDFESRLFCKPNAAVLLREELSRRSYRPALLGLGVNTDAYQPVERRLGITREILAVLAECRHPTTIVTKSALIERDLDLLTEMARDNTVEVAISITTLNRDVALSMEPRATAPERRLETIARLSDAGIPTMVFVAPVVPVLTDHELERILELAREAGAVDAAYIPLRLPLELKELFESWLRSHFPDSANHVLGRMRDLHGGSLYDSSFGKRMRGSGVFAQLLRQRFRRAYERLRFTAAPPLDCDRFRPPSGDQLLLL